uniref:KNOX2 domain-containing protein n=1 Tax=Zea mays TaxID=4577 RepID=A0A804QSZ1_MAIZE
MENHCNFKDFLSQGCSSSTSRSRTGHEAPKDDDFGTFSQSPFALPPRINVPAPRSRIEALDLNSHDHYHDPWASSLSVVVVQLPPRPPGADLPLNLNTVAAPRCVRQGKGALIVGGDVEAIKAKEMEARQHTTLGGLAAETEPELDQFLEAYLEVLVKLREELTRPL